MPLRLPASTGRLRWELIDEQGCARQGEADAGALPETGRIESGGHVCERVLHLPSSLEAGY